MAEAPNLLVVLSELKYDAGSAPRSVSKGDGPQPRPAVMAINGDLALGWEWLGDFVFLNGYQMTQRTLLEPIVHARGPPRDRRLCTDLVRLRWYDTPRKRMGTLCSTQTNESLPIGMKDAGPSSRSTSLTTAWDPAASRRQR